MSKHAFPQDIRPGVVLVADPGLHDPNFLRTLILLVSHDESGSFGFVINRATDQVLGDVADNEELEGLAPVPVFFGGPVATDRIILSGLRWQTQSSDSGSLFLVQSFNPGELGHVEQDGLVLRAFRGYTGWNAGQLEREMAENSWLVVEPDRELIEAVPDTHSWKKVLRRLGPFYAIQAEFSDRPWLN